MQNIIIKPQDVISQKEACDLLSISRTHLCKLKNEGKVRFVKDKCNERSTYVLKSDVEQLVNNRFYLI